MGLKKRRNAILEALQGLFRGEAARKHLKKARAFRAFIEKLEDRRATVSLEIEHLPAEDETKRAALQRQIEILDAQIPKAQQLLVDMEAKERRRADEAAPEEA